MRKMCDVGIAWIFLLPLFLFVPNNKAEAQAKLPGSGRFLSNEKIGAMMDLSTRRSLHSPGNAEGRWLRKARSRITHDTLRLGQAVALRFVPQTFFQFGREIDLHRHNMSQSLISAGVRVVIPEIADYEVRRELLRARKTAGIERLFRDGQGQPRPVGVGCGSTESISPSRSLPNAGQHECSECTRSQSTAFS